MTRDEKRREKTFSILRQLDEHKIGLAQARAQLKDLRYSEGEIDLYIDGDIDGLDEDQLVASRLPREVRR